MSGSSARMGWVMLAGLLVLALVACSDAGNKNKQSANGGGPGTTSSNLMFANPDPGKDPVTGEAADGNTVLAFRGRTYAFANKENIRVFLANPSAYLPSELLARPQPRTPEGGTGENAPGAGNESSD